MLCVVVARRVAAAKARRQFDKVPVPGTPIAQHRLLSGLARGKRARGQENRVTRHSQPTLVSCHERFKRLGRVHVERDGGIATFYLMHLVAMFANQMARADIACEALHLPKISR